ncbi:MAG: AraC family transcriptional regulator [Oliverpabstia sp.]
MKQTTGYTSSSRYKCLEDMQKNLNGLCLSYCGWEYCDPGHRFGPNKRVSDVLHIVKEGKGTLEINGKKYELSKGDAFYIPSNTEAWYEADQKNPWAYMWVGFTGYKSSEYAEHAGFSLEAPVRAVQGIDKLGEYIDCILDAHQLSYIDELRRSGYLLLIFSELIEDYRKNVPDASFQDSFPGNAYVKQAMDYIAQHYREKIKINEIADRIGVNRSYLTSSFKKLVGRSPQEYLIDLRMERAKTMLLKTNMQIHAVASYVGYSDQLAFSKIFKQHYGVSPKAYRELITEELVIKSQKGDYQRRLKI